MADFTIKRHDRLPKLRATLQQGSPATPIDLTDAVSVRIILSELEAQGTPALVTGDCTILTPSSGIVEYAWGTDDTAVSATYNGEFEIDWGGGIVETIPNDNYFTLTIVDDLD